MLVTQCKKLLMHGLPQEYKEGNDIDLICDYRRFIGNDSKVCLPTSNHQLDCHGYTLKKYLEFLIEKNNTK